MSLRTLPASPVSHSYDLPKPSVISNRPTAGTSTYLILDKRNIFADASFSQLKLELQVIPCQDSVVVLFYFRFLTSLIQRNDVGLKGLLEPWQLVRQLLQRLLLVLQSALCPHERSITHGQAAFQRAYGLLNYLQP